VGVKAWWQIWSRPWQYPQVLGHPRPAPPLSDVRSSSVFCVRRASSRPCVSCLVSCKLCLSLLSLVSSPPHTPQAWACFGSTPEGFASLLDHPTCVKSGFHQYVPPSTATTPCRHGRPPAPRAPCTPAPPPSSRRNSYASLCATASPPAAVCVLCNGSSVRYLLAAALARPAPETAAHSNHSKPRSQHEAVVTEAAAAAARRANTAEEAKRVGGFGAPTQGPRWGREKPGAFRLCNPDARGQGKLSFP